MTACGIPAGAEPLEGAIGKLVGVGVGPGNPDLLTRQAIEVIENADRVAAPAIAADVPGRAESIVTTAIPGIHLERLVIAMPVAGRHNGRGAEGDAGGDAGDATRSSYDMAARRIACWLGAGEDVAFVTLGDPNIYSTFPTVAQAVRTIVPELQTETVAGICAFQDLAARSGTVLLDGSQSLALVSARDGAGELRDALARPDRAVVVYKGGNHLPAIVSVLEEHGRLEGAILGELLGMPGERVVPLSQATGPVSYLASVIIPPGDP